MQVGRSTLALVEMPPIAKNSDALAAIATNFILRSPLRLRSFLNTVHVSHFHRYQRSDDCE
jgi:hypothetical protein